ncbi:hypothetical protein LTR91_018028 [Friedmanniomyces endolithicus]|uniref:Kinesin-like protein n=1 Tax=Friedmanniomyces endolithicus TaxID=329885 RepID=A0AAN6HDZ6_9PEZI|nr:hypothetical protein LTR94_017177 [Friedmanniomyces endolithicus]KAK0803414.1 hypothetical protein LTR75_007996 [Friedmanniomyces endolithicus]KAK0813011.1 hypothetical protein LTR59_001389 [Friedmanniomyces endolithicus]KAK0820098.1 hypothetical protein LTR38_000005 [Friedmanniomyces endolithicus]KAK0839658.1 hypothetical protein LTR03_011130 [Friedmanniomyces endolithicus]
MATSNTIKVVARFRPQNDIEKRAGSEQVVDFTGEDTCSITSRENSGAFTFDRVFSTNTPQHDVFEYSIRHTVDDVLAGYNGTVFAYGQTGSGKTYTMMGDITNESGKGIIPRIVGQIFSSIMRCDASIEFTVRVAYMEIYMEKIRDLLVPENDNLPIHEDAKQGVYVKGLQRVYVSDIAEVYRILEIGAQARAVASTNMNQESSRSHSIFEVEIAQKNVETGSARSGRLFLVDLAGSEKVGKTGASGQTLEEAKKINKSLSALGMVINALSDGKSSHVPYRDSKLTRILQESLGGNSRTTLIINCSPSSYNDAETISTLRFGERAKTIKQKAKINEELSPAQLKALLKKAQSQVSSLENYFQSLEGEVGMWRKGEQVPKEQWTPALKDIGRATVQAPPRSATPSRMRSGQDTPSTPRPESRMELERSSTPSLPMEKDEKEEFLKRENELQDQLAEKESSMSAAEQALMQARKELSELRELHTTTGRSTEKLQADNEILRMQIQKVEFETREEHINMESIKEANAELTSELDEVKQQLLDTRMSAKESSQMLNEKERLKKERMAQMMAGFDLGDGTIGSNELHVREMIQQVDSLLEVAESGDAVAVEELQVLKERLLETQSLVRQSELTNGSSNGHAEDASVGATALLEQKLSQARQDYQSVLSKHLSSDDVDDIKRQLYDSLATSHHETAYPSPSDLPSALTRQQEENAALRADLETLRTQHLNGTPTPTAIPNPHTKALADFDTIKKSLMRDLQNRCERVVELEISLDATREQYNAILRSSNSKQQAKKLAFLERNLEQLTLVQRQLVEQNAQLKKEVAIAERKLVARGERIRGLEGLVGESQERLMSANHKFESQLLAVKERLEAAKSGASRGLPSGTHPPGMGYAASGNQFGRIAKPLRGGGGGGGGGGGDGGGSSSMVPTFAGLQAVQGGENGNGDGKRGSWFFNQRT